MIPPELMPQTLRALHRLIVHAKTLAYESATECLGDLLNDIELIPEFLADDVDRTDELIATMRGIARIHPGCLYIVEEFDRAASLP